MSRVLALAVLVACTSPSEDTRAHAISSGSPASGDPAVFALVDAAGDVGCTATVIGPHTGITAAHCIAGRDPRSLRAFFGSAVADGGTFIAISHGRMHPGFDPGGRDIAMLTLRDAAPVSPVAIEPAALDTTLVGTSLRVVGFGLSRPGLDDAGQKREGTARIAAVRDEELVAVPDPSLPCLGDSGGPALLPAGTIAGVVSRTDSQCRDHAVYTRIDTARAALIDPYLAETAPGTAATGAACHYEGHCAEGPCLIAADDPWLAFCARACTSDGDCPGAMICASDGCRYPEPSPGALGSSCEIDADCTSAMCREEACTTSCAHDTCPAGFTCEIAGAEAYCVTTDAGGCGGCALRPDANGDGFALLLVLGALLAVPRRARRGRG